MTALVGAIFLASLLGSFHCAGMCGAFLAIAAGNVDPATSGGWRRQFTLQGAYHAGRLVTYLLLGAAAGTVGRLVDLAGTLAGIRPFAAILAGATMLLFGAVTLLRASGVSIAAIHARVPWAGLVQQGHRAAFARPPLVRALLIGLLTTLLPCGWLYAFAITAAGTGSPLRGALAMLVFWLGTLPILVTLGAGLRTVAGPIGKRLPAMTAIAVMVAGIYTLTARATLDPLSMFRRLTGTATSAAIVAKPGSAPCCDPQLPHP